MSQTNNDKEFKMTKEVRLTFEIFFPETEDYRDPQKYKPLVIKFKLPNIALTFKLYFKNTYLDNLIVGSKHRNHILYEQLFMNALPHARD